MSNSNLFSEYISDKVKYFLQGFDLNVIAYGQKDSGKSFTVLGESSKKANSGSEQDYGLFLFAGFSVLDHIASAQSV